MILYDIIIKDLKIINIFIYSAKAILLIIIKNFHGTGRGALQDVYGKN